MSLRERTKRTLDWRLWLSLTLLLLVMFLLAGVVRSTEATHEKDTQVRGLIGTLKETQEQAATERVSAAHSRTQLLNYVQALLAYTKANSQQQAALLQWLRQHGIEIPVRFTTVVPVPRAAHTGGKNKPSGSFSSPPPKNPITGGGNGGPGHQGPGPPSRPGGRGGGHRSSHHSRHR